VAHQLHVWQSGHGNCVVPQPAPHPKIQFTERQSTHHLARTVVSLVIPSSLLLGRRVQQCSRLHRLQALVVLPTRDLAVQVCVWLCVWLCVCVHVYASSRGGRIVQRCCSLVCAAPPALINLTCAPVQQHGRAPFRPLTIAASPPATPSRHRQVHAVFAQLCPSVGLALGLAAAQAPLAAEAQGIMGGVVSWVARPLPPWSTQRAAAPRTRPATCLRHAPPTTCTTLLAMGCPTAGSAAGGRGCVRVLG